MLFELFQTIEKEQSPPDSFYKASITWILKVDQYIIKKEKL